MEPNKVYKIMIYNWDDTAQSSGFTLSMYAAVEFVKLNDSSKGL